MVPLVTAPIVVVGDSTLVTLDLRDAAGLPASATLQHIINFSIDTSFVVTDGTATVASMPIDPAATSVSFWVKALQQGTSELTVTSPTLRTFRYVFTTRPGQ
jgi:hypothetical protein